MPSPNPLVCRLFSPPSWGHGKWTVMTENLHLFCAWCLQSDLSHHCEFYPQNQTFVFSSADLSSLRRAKEQAFHPSPLILRNPFLFLWPWLDFILSTSNFFSLPYKNSPVSGCHHSKSILLEKGHWNQLVLRIPDGAFGKFSANQPLNWSTLLVTNMPLWPLVVWTDFLSLMAG